jgi:hypothetical protein
MNAKQALELTRKAHETKEKERIKALTEEIYKLALKGYRRYTKKYGINTKVTLVIKEAKEYEALGYDTLMSDETCAFTGCVTPTLTISW